MSGEKTEQPTPRKLRKARDKGEVWKSTEVTQTADFCVLLLLGWLGVELYLPRLKALFDAWPQFIAQASGVSLNARSDQVALAALEQALRTLFVAWAPAILVPVCVGLFVTALQVRGVFSIDPLLPKAERLNPGANLKSMVSSRNLVDLTKTLVKVTMISLAVTLTLKSTAPQWLHAVSGASPIAVANLLGRALLAVSLACLALYVFMAAVDYAHQYYEYMKQQRMSKDEVLREYKEIEGDPYIKAHRRALGMAMAMEQPASKLPKASVVITNPTHLSVAIAYDRAAGGLPSVVAKGAGPMAMAIRHEAKRLGIPIVENKPLARQLYSQVNVGAFITAETFADVARLLASVPQPVRRSGESRDRV